MHSESTSHVHHFIIITWPWHCPTFWT